MTILIKPASGDLASVSLSAAALAGCLCDNGRDGAPRARGAASQQGDNGSPAEGPVVDQGCTPVEKALAAMGGAAALLGLTSIQFRSKGAQSILFEAYLPDQPLRSCTFELTLHHDITNDSMRLDYQRTITAFDPTATTAFSEILKGRIGYVAGAESVFGFPAGDMRSDRWASIRKQQRLLNPAYLLRDVAANRATAIDGGVGLLDGSAHHRIVIEDDVHPITLWVNATTGRVAKASTVENEHLRRDIDIEVYYHGWEPVGALLLPTMLSIAMGGQSVHEEKRTRVEVNTAQDPALFQLPAGAKPAYDVEEAARGEASHQFHQQFAGLGTPLDGEQTFVQPTQLADGVYHLVGGTHHSLAVEQSGGVVIVEAPLYEARSKAILDWVGTTFGGKQVTHVISTHFHQDHSGGLRTFAAAGATVVTGTASAEFLRDVFARRSTIVPDDLASEPQGSFPLVPVAPSAMHVIRDAVRPVGAYSVNTKHSADMVIAYLPNEQIVFVSDIFNPNFPSHPAGGVELHDAILAHGLTVATIAGGHGTSCTWGELLALIAR
jgi:glyoxylase-like metal-dependent hydrolase (beta-lactamase superfamily II)